MRKTDRECGRLRSHLTPAETERLLEAAGRTENGVRDRTLVLLMLRHALRLGEALDLRWAIDIDFTERTLLVRRLKSGRSGLHPLAEDEIKLLLKLRELFPSSTFVFPSGRTGGKLTKSQTRALVEALRDIVDVLADADPEDKAEAYAELGVSLTYHTDGRVAVQALPRGVKVRVGGGT